MVPLTWHLAAIQGMRGDQIVARLRLRTRRALTSSRLVRRAGHRAASLATPCRMRPLGLTTVTGRTAGPGKCLPSALAVEALLTRAAEVAAGRFRFLNEERHWALPVDWSASGASRLWRFHLHYFDDAPVLALAASALGDPRYARLFGDLADDWITQNTMGAGDGWHPYTLSRRIPNWIYALELTGLRGTTDGERIAASVREQSRFLMRNLEFDALGNHLLANVRALLFAGSFFADAEAQRWWDRGARILRTELAEQFLADGGHFERSPMYHALVLQDVLECAALFQTRESVPGWLAETCLRAESWLRQMCHPDGDVALFNDCTLEGPAPSEIAAFTAALCGGSGAPGFPGWREQVWLGDCEARGGETALPDSCAPAQDDPGILTALPQSGYFVLRDPTAGHALFFDAGEPCPSYIPAHAHADLLSYELSLFGRRVIVDSGVCEYAAGPWRDYCRSTRAHNTVQVDGRDQSEVWGGFRLGRRAHPFDVRWSATGDRAEISAAHTGYRRLPGGVVHRRTVTFDGVRFRVCDEVTGSGQHRVESFLHFHPEMQVRLDTEGVCAEGQGVRLVVRWGSSARAELRGGEETRDVPLQGWYCPDFGVRQASPVVVLTFEGSLPVSLDYEIVPGDPPPLGHNDLRGRDSLAVDDRLGTQAATNSR